jgi:hypothetical protein
MQIQGFNISEKKVKNHRVKLSDILIFPLLLVGTPFLFIGFLFFSMIDKIKNGSSNDWKSINENWNGFEFELTSTNDLNQPKFIVDPDNDLYLIESRPSIPLLKDFYVGDYLFTDKHGFFLGFSNESECMQLIIVSDNTSYSVDLGEGNWAFEDDHHHENDYCQLRNWEEKTSTIFTLKPVKA